METCLLNSCNLHQFIHKCFQSHILLGRVMGKGEEEDKLRRHDSAKNVPGHTNKLIFTDKNRGKRNADKCIQNHRLHVHRAQM